METGQSVGVARKRLSVGSTAVPDTFILVGTSVSSASLLRS